MSPLDSIVGLTLAITCGIGLLVCAVVYLIHCHQQHLARKARRALAEQRAREDRIAHELHAVARKRLIRNVAHIEARRDLAHIEAFANGEVSR